MSGNRVSPEPSDGSPMETHPLQPLGEDAQIQPPAYSPQNNGQAADDGINFGDTRVHEPSMSTDLDSTQEVRDQTVREPENYDLPGSVTHSRDSLHNSRESGIHSRESVARSRESIQHSRESLKLVGQSHDPLPESPDHQLPPMPDLDHIPDEGRHAYTPALPREDSNLGAARYESPPPYADHSTAGSQAELLPSEKMVPLSPIGNNRVGPATEHHTQEHPSARHPGPVYEETSSGPPAPEYGETSSGRPAPVYAGSSSDYPRRSLSRQMSERDLIHKNIRSDDNTDGAGCCGWLLYIFSILLIAFTLPFSLMFTIKVVQEYERAVIFRLGRLPSGGAKGPGIFFIIPCIESYSKVDLRTVSFDVPPQEVLTKDSVTVSVDAVVYYRVSNPTVSVANVENAHHSTRLLAQTTLRNILGTKNMSEILSDREAISHGMQSSLDEATDRWGIKVERVEIKDVRLPVQLQRAMAAEAEASREARAKVIAAEGEQKASKALKEAADVMCQSSAALQLRYLQTLNSISAEKNSTIIFPLPVDMLSCFLKR